MRKKLAWMAAGLLPSCLWAGDGSESRPNIILLMADQLRFDYIGTVNPDVHTPNLDALASEGYRFVNGYSSTPSSTPARASLLTGFSPWHHGLLGYYGRIGERYKYEMPRMLDSVGYYTVGVGKMHWTPQRNTHGFHELYLDESGRVESPGFVSDYRQWFAREAPGVNPDTTGLGWNDHAARTYLLDERLHPTRWTGDVAVEHIEAYEGDRPLFMKISFARPHSPYDPPARMLQLYADRQMPEPAVGEWCDEFAPPMERSDAPYGNYGKEHALHSRKHYAASVSFIDEQIGRIVAALKGKGMYENTLIVFISDHGDMLQSHCLYAKGPAAYEEICHVPFLLWGFGQGEVETPVSHIDIAPTLWDFFDCGEKPMMLQGESLLPLLKGEQPASRDVFIEFGRYEADHDGFGGFQPMRCIFDGRYKLVLNLLSEDELYDLQTDPYEMDNRLEDPLLRTVRDELLARLLAHMNQVRDPLRGYYWERRPWNTDANAATWDYTGFTRQRSEPDYEKSQLDYNTGLVPEELVRKKF